MKATYFTEAGDGRGLGHLKRYEAFANLLPELEIEPILYRSDFQKLNGFRSWTNETTRQNWALFDSSDIVIVDSYVGDSDFFASTNCLEKVIYIDDFLILDYPRGLFIDWTVGAEIYRESVGEATAFGLEYCPVRAAFKDQLRTSNKQELINIVTVFGGDDPADLTPQVYRALSGRYNVTCVATSSYPCFNDFKHNPHFKFDLTDDDYVQRLLSADLVISAGGQSLYELTSLGVPTMAISIADNQTQDVSGFLDRGMIFEWSPTDVPLKDLANLISSITSDEIAVVTRNMRNVVRDGSMLRSAVLDYLKCKPLGALG